MSEEKTVKEGLPNTIEVIVDDDKMAGFVKFLKTEESTPTFSKEQIIDELKQNGIEFGINETANQPSTR